MAPGANVRAAKASVLAMKRDGRLEAVDKALVTAFLSLAEAVDASPGNANLWRRYLDAEMALRGLHGDRADNVVGLLGRLRAPIRHHPAPEPGDAG